MRGLVILGSGGFARQIVSLVEDLNNADYVYDLLGFVTKDAGASIDDVPVLGGDDQLALLDADYVVGVEDPSLRRKLSAFAERSGCMAARLIHPTARIDRRSEVGTGAVVFEGANVVYGARIGRHVIMNLNSIASHDSHIGDYVELTSNSIVGARVNVGDDVMLGMSSVVLNDLKVGEHAVIGAGAVVTRDVPPNTCVVGVPARPIKTSH